MGFFQPAAAFVMIASRTGSYHVGPDVFTAQMLGKYVVHGQVGGVAPAVLTDEVIPAEDLAAVQLDLQARAVDHVLQADDRRLGDQLGDGMDIAAPV